MARIFISYKRVDKDKVFKIKDQIESALGEKCWIDLDGIESDAQFVNVIINAIDRAEIMLFMYSHLHTQIKDFEKDWTIRELDYANEENKRIVFVNLDESPLKGWFKFMYGKKQQVSANSEDAFDRLLLDLRKWLDIPLTSQQVKIYDANMPLRNSVEVTEVSSAETVNEKKTAIMPEQKKLLLEQIVSSIIASKSYSPSLKKTVGTHEAVDMGLSVCWARVNIGAKNIEDNGDYFAWGETKPKEFSQFTKTRYLLGKPSGWGMKIHKYNDQDNIRTLDVEDDAATQQWGSDWRMPTEQEMEELCKNCTIEEIEYKGTNLLRFTSNINKHVIHFPLNGYIKDGMHKNFSGWYPQAYLWTSSKNNLENEAVRCNLINLRFYIYDFNRWHGCAIRPVTEKYGNSNI